MEGGSAKSGCREDPAEPEKELSSLDACTNTRIHMYTNDDTVNINRISFLNVCSTINYVATKVVINVIALAQWAV